MQDKYSKLEAQTLKFANQIKKNPILYKFKPLLLKHHNNKIKKLDTHLESIFKNDELWFSSMKSFNDPFEGEFVLDQESLINETKLKIPNLASNMQLDEVVLKDLVDTNFVSKFESEIKLLFENSGVGCFIRDEKNLLMWTHYADNGKGICLEFNVLNSPQTFTFPIVINYSNDYPIIDSLQDGEKLITTILGRKSKIWEYENEFRILKKNKGGHPIKPKAILSIIFGYNCPMDEINLFKDFITSLGDKYRHLKYYKMTLDKQSYKLVKDSI